jgi:ABC-2 type transport system permease protein
MRGGFVPLAALVTLFVLAILALGTLVSVVSETQLQAHFINVFIFVVSILMSGFIFPIEAMPRWLQPTALVLPMTYFLDGIRGLMLKGTSMMEAGRDLAALAGFALLFVVLCMVGLRKQAA